MNNIYFFITGDNTVSVTYKVALCCLLPLAHTF